MKRILQKRILAFVLAFAIILPSLMNVAELSVLAIENSTYAEPVVYDISDLTGSNTNTVKGTDETWDGQILGEVSTEHKENIVFRTKLTMGKQQVRLAINAKEGTSIYDPPGYAVYINDNNGAPYVAIYRNQKDLVVGSVPAVHGTYELEIGLVDILTDGIRTGKHIYVKMDDQLVCEVDDTAGYLTGSDLGTRFVDFHYGAAIQMDTTCSVENTYGTANVYDIYDLTGEKNNIIKGTDETWDGQLLGSVKEEHKENIVFKTKLTMGAQQVRLAINAKEGTSVYDPPGYAVYINDNNGEPYVAIYRNQKDLVVGSVPSVKGSYVLEIGLVDILTDGVRTGKHLYVKMDDQLVCEVDDTAGYLTGSDLGTKIVDFHYGAAIQMDTTCSVENTYGTANVYDIYDLTGSKTNTIKGTNDTWEGQIFADINPAHKENMAFKTKLTMGAQQVRLSINAKAGADIYDPPGYALYLYGETGRVELRKNNATLKDATVSGVAGTYILEVGIVDILQNGVRTGKHLYVKMNEEIVCQYDDLSGYLTGDALGTKIVDFHYGASIQMDTANQTEPEEPTEPELPMTAAQAEMYDIYDLKGTSQLTVAGQLQGNWGTTLGHVEEAHKANIAFTSNISIDEAQTILLGLGLTDLSQAVQLNSGYVLEIVNKTGNGEKDTLKIHRAGTQICIQDMDTDFHGEHALEFGMVDLLAEDAVKGKRIYVKLDGVQVFSCDDKENFLSADHLGTKVDIYVSGNDLLMSSSRNYSAVNANVYDLYDLTFRETLDVKHIDDMGNINWGVLIGNADKNLKGNVALKTNVSMSRNQQQNLIVGLGMTSHWPVGSGYGYKVELNGNPENKTDSLFIYKNTDSQNNDPVCVYSMEQNFDFNSSFQLEVGVVDLLDENQAVAARRIYVKINGEELACFDDTKDMIYAGDMGTIVAAYVSGGVATLSTCAGSIPKANVKVYDIYDLQGRASVQLNRTDAGGAVIWSHMLGEVSDTNNLNYALRVNVDTSKMDRTQMQELILGLCKGSELFDKNGYRMSLYFGTDGGISIVLRDSADEVLASADGVFPKNFTLEMGITDFYNSSKKMIGKKIYLKIDAEEVLTYVDKEARAKGNLLCAYTTSPIKLATRQNYTTIPVTYMVNGEKVETSKYIISNTDVILGQKSIIDVALGNKDAYTSVIMEQVLLNGQPITAVSEKQDVYTFELENPSAEDELTVQIRVRELTVDEAEVYDLYELTGKKKIVISANSVDQIGTLFADGQEGVLNRAIRFAYYIPKTGGGLRLGYGSDTSDIWSRVGTHIEIWCGFATISHGFHVSALSSGNTDIFKPDSWSIVEVGIVKCYEDGVYKYDRWYVKAGESLEDMQLITYFDSTQRHDSSLNIMARTPDTGDDFILASTMDVRQVTDISEDAAKNEATVAFKPLFLKGEAVKIVVFPMEGKKLETLSVNGEQVETVLNSDGGYTFVLENAQEDISFRYSLADDNSIYHITADDGENLKFILDKTSVVAGGSVTVQIKMDGGYTLKSLTVNEADFLPMVSYDKTTLTYTLTISGIREDKHIQAEAEKRSLDGPVAESGNTKDEGKTSLPIIIAVVAVSLAVLGAIVTVVIRAGKKGRKQ